MLDSFKMNLIQQNVRFVSNDLRLYNIFVGEVQGQISDGKWENSRRPMEYFWLPNSVYDKDAQVNGFEIKRNSHLKYYYENASVPNVMDNGLLSADYEGDYYYVRRAVALIAAAEAGMVVTYDNNILIERAWGCATLGISAEEAIALMKKRDEENKDENYMHYMGFKRWRMSEEEFTAFYNKMLAFAAKGDYSHYGPRSYARKVAATQLKRLKEAMHQFIEVE